MSYILTVDPVKHDEQRKRWEELASGTAYVGGKLNLDDLLKAAHKLHQLRKSQPVVDQVVYFRTEEDRARFIAWANLDVKEVPTQFQSQENSHAPNIRHGTAPS